MSKEDKVQDLIETEPLNDLPLTAEQADKAIAEANLGVPKFTLLKSTVEDLSPGVRGAICDSQSPIDNAD